MLVLDHVIAYSSRPVEIGNESEPAMAEAIQATMGEAKVNGPLWPVPSTKARVFLHGPPLAALAAIQSWADAWLVHLSPGPPKAERPVRVLTFFCRARSRA